MKAIVKTATTPSTRFGLIEQTPGRLYFWIRDHYLNLKRHLRLRRKSKARSRCREYSLSLKFLITKVQDPCPCILRQTKDPQELDTHNLRLTSRGSFSRSQTLGPGY